MWECEGLPKCSQPTRSPPVLCFVWDVRIQSLAASGTVDSLASLNPKPRLPKEEQVLRLRWGAKAALRLAVRGLVGVFRV